MTTGSEQPDPHGPGEQPGPEPTTPYGQVPGDRGEQPTYQQPTYQQPTYHQPTYQQQPYGQPGYAQPGYGQAVYGQPGHPYAPYGVHPITGVPYSDKSKIVAGLLQILVPFGIGRFYVGDTNIGIAQLLVTIFTCGIGALWPMVDGIIMLASDSKDANGLMLRS